MQVDVSAWAVKLKPLASEDQSSSSSKLTIIVYVNVIFQGGWPVVILRWGSSLPIPYRTISHPPEKDLRSN